MNLTNKKEPMVLFLGDLVIFYLAVWVSLLIRHFEIPSSDLFILHIQPFSILFVVWILVIYITGLYDRLNSGMRRNLPQTLFNTQIINIVLAVVFFYFIPYFTVTPKIVLFVYLFVSLLMLAVWRLMLQPKIFKMDKQNSLLIARGEEMKELKEEINRGNYGHNFTSCVDLENVESVDIQEDIVKRVYAEDAKVIVIDTQDNKVTPLLSSLYNLMFAKVNFADMHEIYEQVFGKIPLSLVKHGWFLKNVTTQSHAVYDGAKRAGDIVISIVVGVISLVLYPFIIIAIKIEDGGKIFFTQERIGQDNKKIRIIKFRSMFEGQKEKVTKVGRILRATRMDEIPQLLNVLRGDLSLIGPRPEKTDFVEKYSKEIPYYNVRHLVKPGLSGWAQIYQENQPRYGINADETSNKLSYDLYYIKNRSLFLDFKIGVKTLGTILMRKGR